MKRKILITLVIIILCIFAAFFVVDRKYYSHYISSKLESVARDNGVHLRLENARLAFVGLDLDGVRIVPLNTPTAFYIQQPSLRLSLRPLFSQRADIALTGKAYNGSLSVQLSQALDGSLLTGQGELIDLHLPQHPQLQGLGFVDGLLSIGVSGLEAQYNELTELRVEVVGTGLKKVGSTVIPSKMLKGDFPLIIPPFSDFNIGFFLNYNDPVLRVDDFKVTGPHGELRLSLSMTDTAKRHFSVPQKVRLSGEGEVVLTEKGVEMLGSLLPLVSQGKIAATARTFSLRFRGSLAQPVTIFIK